MRLPLRAAVQVREGPGTEDSSATVSHGMAVSISLTLRVRGGVQVAPQTGLAGEGLFRMDAFGQPFISALLVPKLPLWLTQSSAVASAAAGRPPGTAGCA